MKLTIIILFLITQFMFANTWRLKDPKFISERKAYDFNSLELKYKKEVKVVITYKKELPSRAQYTIKEFLDQFYKDKDITFNKVDFHYQDGEISFLIDPITLKEKKDLIQYLLSGIRFYYNQTLTYDFRVQNKTEGGLVRVSGVFKSMDDIVKNIKQASSLFLTDMDEYDPNFLINQIRFLDKEIKEIKAKLKKNKIK